MKRLLTILAVCSVFTVQAADTTRNETFNMVYSDVKEGIKALASSLKVPAEKVWEVTIKQQAVRSVSILTALVIIIVASVVCWVFFSKNCKRTTTQGDPWYTDCMEEHVGLWGLLTVAIILTIVSAIWFVMSVQPILTGFMNPEYGAIKDIVGFIKK